MSEELRIPEDHALRLNQFGPLISRHERLQRYFAIGYRFRNSYHPFLISGEKGTGKEAFARALHLQSSFTGEFCVIREQNSLKKIISSLPAQTTVYIPQLTNISLKGQEQFLALSKMVPKIRIIIAFDLPLENCMTQKLIRPDLVSRLKPIILHLPPLRERQEDLFPLIDIFTREITQQQKTVAHYAASLLVKLSEYDWKGNIGELKTEIHKLCKKHPEAKTFSIEMMPPRIVGPGSKELFRLAQNAKQLPVALETLEKNMILESLHQYQWNKTRVSRTLGISRSGLIQKIHKYKLVEAH